MSFFLGVDAGGTKTEFVLGDEQKELARVRVGSIKRMRVSAEEAERNLHEAVQKLEAASGLKMSSVAHCRIGAAGNTVPLVTDWMEAHFPRVIGGGLSIVNDVEIALDAAFKGQRGVLVLAGTGSNVACRTRTGEVMTAGGWGPALADQGSGHLVGLQGLRRAFLALDEGRPTTIMQKALAHWKLNSIDELVAYGNQQPAPDFSKLTPLFVASAEEGDAVAQEVMEQGGRELSELVCLLIERMKNSEGWAAFEAPAVAVTGSVITHAKPIRRAMMQILAARYAGISFVDEPADPPLGALWGAREAGR